MVFGSQTFAGGYQLSNNSVDPTATSNGFRYLCEIVTQLHRQVSRNPPRLVLSDVNSRQEMLRNCTSDAVAITLERLIGFISANASSIRGFRASAVYPLANSGPSWPLLEWTEGEDTEVMAIFELNGVTDLAECNWLVSCRYNSHGPSGGQGRSGSVNWRVTQLRHLKMLFEVAQHLSGILAWSPEDTHRLYCDRSFQRTGEKYDPSTTLY